MVFAILVIGGLCFCLGILYPLIAIIGYKIFGGKKSIAQYIKTL